MSLPRVVIVTSVWVAALRSQRGASNKLLTLIDKGRFEIVVSVPLILEYEDTATRLLGEIPLTTQDVSDILDYICKVAIHQKISYLWRPYLPDPNDDMILELAANAASQYIITFNHRHFQGVEDFGLKVVTPQNFLQVIGVTF